MRTLSFILVFAFTMVGPSLSGPPDGGLPCVGAFSYTGSPIIDDSPPSFMVAAR